jgi:hypothetical protein
MLCRTDSNWRHPTATLFVAVTTISGCVSSPTPENMARNTQQTAAADLQLACATAATTKFGADHASVLPISSSALEGGKYQIMLDAKGQRSTCLIDSTEQVLSLEKT